MSPEEQLDMDRKVLYSCKDREGATDDDINGLLDRKVPTDPKAKCLLACAHETLGIVCLFYLLYFNEVGQNIFLSTR